MSEQSCCLFSGEEIRGAGLISGAKEELYRASTYDLSVGEIILAGGSTHTETEYSLPPGGMVRVISQELLKLPDTVTGHVLLKNQLCTRGVLALSIGVVDPGFEGPISSTLINFGHRECLIESGLPFLRVSFFRCPSSAKAGVSERSDREGYVKRVRKEVREYSGSMFLNVDVIAADAAKRAFGSFKEGLILWATVATVLIALLAIFAPLGASFVDKYLVSNEQRDVALQNTIEKDIEARYEVRIKQLSDEIDTLKPQSPSVGRKNARKNNE